MGCSLNDITMNEWMKDKTTERFMQTMLTFLYKNTEKMSRNK